MRVPATAARNSRFFTVMFLCLGAAVLVFGCRRDEPSAAGGVRCVILVSIDTCRADHLSCYGYKHPTTPGIDALAQEAVLFEHAISPAPLTLPAHTSMLCGTVPAYHGVHDNIESHVDPSNLTLAEIVREHGYATAACVSTFVLDSQFGLDQGFDTYDDEFEEPHSFLQISERRAEETTRRAQAWIEQHRDEKFFLFLHYYDPHADYRPPQPFGHTFPDPYDGEIAYVDHCVTRVLDTLKNLNLYDAALILITSDHGEGLGQHAENEHSFFIYQSVMHVPLIIKPPLSRKGKKIRDYVGIIDVPPTILACLGIPCPDSMQGVDLSPAYSDVDTTRPDRLFLCESFEPTKYGCNPLLGVVGKGWKYIQAPVLELYNLQTDSREEANLAAAEPQLASQFRAALRELLNEQIRLVENNNLPAIDAESLRRLESLGYVAGTSDDSYDFDPNKPDAKDFIDYHRLSRQYKLALNAKQYEEAIQLSSELLELYPNKLEIHLKCGRAAFQKGDLVEAAKHFDIFVKSFPKNAKGWYSMGETLLRTGRLDEAVFHLDKALQLEPNNWQVHTRLGQASVQLERDDDAMRHWQKALSLAGTNRQAQIELRGLMALHLAQSGSIGQAVEHWQSIAQLAPDNVAALYGLAKAADLRGDENTASANYERLLALNPDHVGALNNLAWLLATTTADAVRDPDRAIELAEKASKLDRFQSPTSLDTLAVAYASAGDFERATHTAQQALDHANAVGNAELAEEIRNRLRLYENGLPYRPSSQRPSQGSQSDPAS